ncbi:hypothetical protein YTPLAS73_09670 [Nitrosarchaeum sp.]|nr:hypothetical protein YTPLAS73_09670 [Nitrosarchaeum sp.]
MTEESSKAIEYLECRQKKIIGDEKKYQRKVKTELKRVSRKLCKEFLKKYGKELSKKEKSFYKKNTEECYNQLIETQHSTAYENPILISILHDLNEQLQEGAENIKIKTHGVELSLKDSDVFENPPYIGTLPTGEVNAQIRYFSSTKEYLIIFQDEIFNFCNLFSKIIALSFPYMRDEIITERDGKKIPPIGYSFFSIDEKISKKQLKTIHRSLKVLKIFLHHIL